MMAGARPPPGMTTRSIRTMLRPRSRKTGAQSGLMTATLRELLQPDAPDFGSSGLAGSSRSGLPQPSPFRSCPERCLGRRGATSPNDLTPRGLRARPDGARASAARAFAGSAACRRLVQTIWKTMNILRLMACAIAFAMPQLAAGPAAADLPAAATAASQLQFQSAFADYKAYEEALVADWRQVNDSVRQAAEDGGGHAGHGAQEPPTDPGKGHGAFSAPSPAPREEHTGHGMHGMHGGQP